MKTLLEICAKVVAVNANMQLVPHFVHLCMRNIRCTGCDIPLCTRDHDDICGSIECDTTYSVIHNNIYCNICAECKFICINCKCEVYSLPQELSGLCKCCCYALTGGLPAHFDALITYPAGHTHCVYDPAIGILTRGYISRYVDDAKEKIKSYTRTDVNACTATSATITYLGYDHMHQFRLTNCMFIQKPIIDFAISHGDIIVTDFNTYDTDIAFNTTLKNYIMLTTSVHLNMIAYNIAYS